MSEARSVREIVVGELCESNLKRNAYFAFLSGAIRGAGEVHFTQSGFAVGIKSPNKAFMELVASVLGDIYGEKPYLDCNEMYLGYTHDDFYSVYLAPPDSVNLLERCCIIRDKYELVDNLPKSLLGGKAAKKAFLRGLFLACGFLRTPEVSDDITEQTQSGYTLSFNLNSDIVKKDVKRLISEEALIDEERIREKKTGNGIYIKNSEAICNVLTFLGSVTGVLTLHEVISARRMRNDINRANNFDLANIDKAVETGSKQVDAIKKLEENGLYATLSDGLKQMCDMRKAHPDLGLEELGKEFSPPITKSCVNHRLRKLMELAQTVETE